MRRTHLLRAIGWPGAVLALFALPACSSSPTVGSDPDPLDDSITVPARGTASTFDVATWNIQHFGSPSGGPSDDARQLIRARDVILGTDVDLWAVQEIRDADDFRSLVAQLPGYAGLLANDATVTDGAAYYSDFGDTEHKVGLVYKTAVVQSLAARVVLTDLDYEFAGRPPLEVEVRLTLGGVTRDAVVLVLHGKADAQIESYERRQAAGNGLMEHLDTSWPDTPVLVMGDWNDDVNESIVTGRDTPYRALVDAAPDWVFTTSGLTAAGETSILGFPNVIDHILASDETMTWYQAGSASVYRLHEIVSDYKSTTSDHLPVLSRFVIGN